MNIMHMMIPLFVIVILLMWKDENCTNREHMCPVQSTSKEQIAAIGASARDACNRISTEAENITARANGRAAIARTIGTVLNPASALLDPRSYRGGDNNTVEYMRTLINNNLSTCERTLIQNTCRQSNASTQSNIIDFSNCYWCRNNPCHIRGVRQTNTAELSNTCSIKVAIDMLVKKTGNIEAQALAEVLMEAEGVLSGNNNYQRENCNIINNDMSTVSYMESRSDCIQKNSVDQTNALLCPASVTDTIQSNHSSARNKCLMNTASTTNRSTGTITTIINSFIAEMTTKGASLEASSASLSSIILIAGVIFFMTQTQTPIPPEIQGVICIVVTIAIILCCVYFFIL